MADGEPLVPALIANVAGTAKDFAAHGWYGYGRWDAPYWFVGMEPGGDDSDASYEVWRELGGAELIDCKKHHFRSGFRKWHDGRKPPTQSTWRRLIQLLLGYQRRPADLEAARRYQVDEWGSCRGETALLEVSALHARSAALRVAREHHRHHRLEVMRTRLEECRPKLVVFYGTAYSSLYEQITGTGFDAEGYVWRPPTLSILVPHPCARRNPRNMRSGDWWITKGLAAREFRDAH